MNIPDAVIIPLFPTPIISYEVEVGEGERSFLLSQYPDNVRVNIGNSSSKDYSILDNKEVRGLKEKLLFLVNNAFTHIHHPQLESGLYITQSWLNFTTKDQFHHRHNHPNSFYSAVLYLKVCDEDIITFYDPHHLGVYEIYTTRYNIFNSSSWQIPVRDNLLLIFPSTIPHSVPNLKHDNVRISLSFNTFLRGEFGNPFNLNHLVLEK
jgi:hypothetical protein